MIFATWQGAVIFATWQGAVVSTSWSWGLQTQTTTLHGRWLLDDFRRAHQAWLVPCTPPLP